MIANFNQKFTQIRKNEGLTQEQFAEKLGISRSSVAKIEANKQEITKNVREKILEKFPNSIISIQKDQNDTEATNFSTGVKWKNETVLEKNHFIFTIIDNYKNDIVEIEYFRNKISKSFSILENLGQDPESPFVQLTEILEKSLKDIKEIYSQLLIGSLTREELITNKDFLTEVQKKKLNSILDETSDENWQNQSRELIQQSKNLLQLYKNSFDDLFELILKYSEI